MDLNVLATIEKITWINMLGSICYLLSFRWFSLEEERVLKQSSVSISPSFENQGINAVGDDAQVTEYLHNQSTNCNQRDKGVVNTFMATRKSEI